MTTILINDVVCWICGKQKQNMTSHHGLPKHLMPKNNVQVPVCRDCHDKINADDVQGMYAYIHRLSKQSDEVSKNLEVIKKILDENTKLRKMKSGEKVTL